MQKCRFAEVSGLFARLTRVLDIGFELVEVRNGQYGPQLLNFNRKEAFWYNSSFGRGADRDV